MSIKLGVAPHWSEDFVLSEMIEHIHEIEELGYEQIWIYNDKFFWDMNSLASLVAMNTRRVKIGTFISDPYSVHPALTAMFINTLQKLSDGRAILGLGAGGTGFQVMGIQRKKPAVAIKEAVHVIRELLKGELVNFKGEVIQCNRGRLHVPTRSDVPIVVASRGDLVFKVGGEIADGVMISTYAEPQGIGAALDYIEKGALEAGRTLQDVTVFARVDACISKDRRAAIDAVKPMIGVSLWNSYPDRVFVQRVGLEMPEDLEEIIKQRDYNLIAPNAHLVPDEFIDKFCWAGTAEEVAEKVAAVVRMGIENITFVPHPPKGGTVHETIRSFAKVVRPLVDEMVKA